MQNCKRAQSLVYRGPSYNGLQSPHTAKAGAQLCMLTQDKSTKLWAGYIYCEIELELAWSKVSTKVCGFTFGSISLHLISKRIKEILTQKHQYKANIYPDLMKKCFQEIKKVYMFSRFQLYA